MARLALKNFWNVSWRKLLLIRRITNPVNLTNQSAALPLIRRIINPVSLTNQPAALLLVRRIINPVTLTNQPAAANSSL
ncbi:MAG TPA: hypothetical protein VJW20_04115 [Candidatus Angelobacter sp.]|nr:hypothetical protein [Candidatus Angelobacter sp.]